MITKPTKYTEEFVKQELKSLLGETLNNKKLVVMGELFENKPYSEQRFSEWAEKFKKNEEISESIKKIKDIFELRVNVYALKKALNPIMAIFNLKHNYGWRDEIDHNVSASINIINDIPRPKRNNKDK